VPGYRSDCGAPTLLRGVGPSVSRGAAHSPLRTRAGTTPERPAERGLAQVTEHRVRDAIQADRASLTGVASRLEVPGAGLLRAVTWRWAVWPGRRLSFQPFHIGRWLADAAKG
jgi:hypothetical protein